MHALCEFLRLGVVRQLALHPDHVAVWRVGDGAVHGTLAAALVAVVALAGSGRVPVEVDVHAGDALGESAGLLVALALALRKELVDQTLLVDVHTGVDGVDDGLVEEAEVSLRIPAVFDCLELGTALPGLLGCDHEVIQGLESWVCGTKDESVVAGVDSGSDESSGFRVGTGNSEEVVSWQIISKLSQAGARDTYP